MTYDLNGNTLNDGTNTYTWDARNRIVSADSNGATFAYDAVGRRTGKNISSINTNFLYDGVNPVQELNGSTVTANLLTGGVDERFLRTTASETDNYLTDALGSTTGLTGSSGNSTVQYSYSPFGSISITGTTSNSYTYTGREIDGLGIDYYRARYYNPAIGRFLSEDPIGFRGGINEYVYVGDSPLSFVDPLGMDKNPFKCASELANKYSLANLAGINTQGKGLGSKVGTAFLGNTFSGLTDLWYENHAGDAKGVAVDMALGGISQGLPVGKGPLAKGLVGLATDAGVNAVTNPGEVLSIAGPATELGEEGLAGPVGWIKLGADALIYGASLASCWE